MTTTTMDLILVYVICTYITMMAFAHSDSFENQRMMAGGYIYPHRLGFLQCKSLCCRYGGCGAVSYLQEHYLCELHGLNSGQSDMSSDSGSVTWIKNASDKESCRECRSFCQGEEQCLVTRRGEFKCLPAKRYFADEMVLKSKRIPSNVELKYLKSWGPSQEQMCRKHKEKHPRKETSISLGDNKTDMYYILIHVSQNKTISKLDKHLRKQGQSRFHSVFKVKYLFYGLFEIFANETYIKVCWEKIRTTYLYPYTMNSELEIDVGILFYPMMKKMSTFVLKFGKFTSFDYQKTHFQTPQSLHDSFCLMPKSVAINTVLGSGTSAKILPFEESKQYMVIWENASNSFFR